MRAGIGILSILVCLAIVMFVMFSGPGGGYVPNTIKAGQNAQNQAQQIAGVDENGMKVQDSVGLKEVDTNGELHGIQVTQILPAGPMASIFSLQAGDVIVEVGPMRVRDEDDPELAKDQIYESTQRSWPLVIERNGEQLTLQPHGPLQAAHPNLFPNAQTPVVPVPTH